MNPTKNMIEPKLYMNPTKNLIELKLYMNPTKNLRESKLYMNPTKNMTFVDYKKGALDSQPQVIKFTSCLPMVGGSRQVLRLHPPLKLVAMI
jgi:hypothetical protein